MAVGLENIASAADELRRQADNFIELADLAPIIARDPAARAQSAANRAAREAAMGIEHNEHLDVDSEEDVDA